MESFSPGLSFSLFTILRLVYMARSVRAELNIQAIQARMKSQPGGNNKV